MQLTPEQFIGIHQVFSRGDLELLVSERTGSLNSGTVDSHLQRWLTQGRIVRIKRGVYAKANDNGKAVVLDTFALASKLAKDAVISHHAAMELHGFAQSYLNTVHFLTQSSVKALKYRRVTYVPVKPRPPCIGAALPTKLVETFNRNGVEVPATSLERTVVDVLDRPDISGGIEEVWRSLSNCPGLRYKELESYLALLSRPTVTARVGFFLEQHKERLAVPEAVLERLEKNSPRSKIYFSRKEKGERKFFSRWNLVVPEKLILSTDWMGQE